MQNLIVGEMQVLPCNKIQNAMQNAGAQYGHQQQGWQYYLQSHSRDKHREEALFSGFLFLV